MFDTIILLTGALERTALASVLHGHRPQLMVHAITTSEDLAAIDRDVLRRARLIAFASPVIVSPGVLSALGFGAYNFHPGPPEYPGWAPAHFALYEGATEFGATAHAMAQRVDSGPIVDVSRFTFPADMDVAALEGLTYAHLARMYWRHAKHLATEAHSLPVDAAELGSKEKFAPGLSSALRHTARYQQGGAQSPHARVRRQPFRDDTGRTSARRPVSRGDLKRGGGSGQTVTGSSAIERSPGRLCQ